MNIHTFASISTMKKVLLAILAVVYISSTTGVSIHMHYCMGELASWGFWKHKSTSCDKCGMNHMEETENGCCKDVHKQVKLDQDHKKQESEWRLVQLLPGVLPVPFKDISFNNSLSVTEENPLSHSPPRGSDIAVYIRNCVFLI